MNFFRWIENLIGRIFGINSTLAEEAEQNVEQIAEQNVEQIDSSNEEQSMAKFEFKNVVFEKLNYLEQYIKSFSKSFPEEYGKYLDAITKHRKDYEQELSNYLQTYQGVIAFAIDPECESKRIAKISELEKDIIFFVDTVVVYTLYKDKFAVLSEKLNRFYNTLVNQKVSKDKVLHQLKNATASAQKLVCDVQNLYFFENDTRKKEEILNYLVYIDYMIFKASVRYGICSSLYEYKTSKSEFASLFMDAEYDSLVLKFLMQDLDKIHLFITENLHSYSSAKQLLECCENSKVMLEAFYMQPDTSNFQDVILLENTLEEASKTFGIDFVLTLPDTVCKNDSVLAKEARPNEIALAVLKLVNNAKANLLLAIVTKFDIAITWDELYFLCKIFEVYQDVMAVSQNTIFSSLEINFLSLDKKYPTYSSEYIAKHKKRLLDCGSSNCKKYILLFRAGEINCDFAVQQLKNLSLDFLVLDDEIYLNHSYFNGFKNLERIFGNYITF